MILNLSSFTIKYGGIGFSLWDIEELAVMKILRESATCLYEIKYLPAIIILPCKRLKRSCTPKVRSQNSTLRVFFYGEIQ